MYDNSYTLKTVGGLITNTYVLAVIVAIIFFFISLFVSRAIAYEGGKNPRDPFKRRVWFFILAAIAIIAFFLWNFLYVSNLIKIPAAKSDFMLHYSIATGVLLVAYLLIGFIASKILKKKKYGTIFS